MAEVGSTWVTVAPSTKGFGRQLDSQIGGEVDGVGKKTGGRFGRAMNMGVTGAVAVGVPSAPLYRVGPEELV